jgi:predicted TIM-barrel enzyme
VELFSGKPLIGMVHMPALPGAPANDSSIAQLVNFALSEIEALEGAGLDGAIVEKVGDAPFFRDRVPALTTAAMTAIVHEAKKHTTLRVGVNIKKRL